MARTSLGEALMTWRAAVAPGDVGLPGNGARRTPGLRREELAQLAGISADYLTRLEQGRAANPSAQVVEALARTLQLTDNERSHLYQLAGLAAPGPDRIPRTISPGVQRMLDRLNDTPVAVFDAMLTELHANPLYVELMGNRTGNERNAAWRNFLGTAGRIRQTPESLGLLQELQVADLRRTAGRYPNDPNLHALIDELRRRSGRFDHLWESGPVAEHQATQKIIDHPRAGAITLDCDVLHVAGDDLRIMVYTAEPGSGDADKLTLLSVVHS
ncbi:XRE family transcriptional regulator [Kribbella antibiotica]|uniref:XRE family transcriptional regulator n=1 Tax=Kribbella antibiotica TaxID=190195 RepID=A0A4R4ZX80_9ACTN|nr:helix-turn-helix transcriptional regulator [Kribbella antibiotica]TDD63200.1 XRE family transcriptional regulator [Kribbella antibiotica]